MCPDLVFDESSFAVLFPMAHQRVEFKKQLSCFLQHARVALEPGRILEFERVVQPAHLLLLGDRPAVWEVG